MHMWKFESAAVILLSVLLFGIINFEEVHAAIDSNSCATECQPPSLGLDLTESRRYVSEGFGINGNFFDVDYFSQTIPTQNFTVTDTVNVQLTIFENSGHQYLEYVGLSIIVDEPFIRGGMLVEEYKTTIEWIKKFDGTKSVNVDDSSDLIDVINVTDSIENDRTILNYEFVVTNPMKQKTIAVTMWDYKRNAWTNYFYKSITVTEKDSILVIPFEDRIISLDIENIDKSNFSEWIQNVFSWYHDGLIEKKQLIQMLKFLIKQGIIQI